MTEDKKTYNGLDLLKFIMALMVVMIHVKPNTHSLILTNIFAPIEKIAVPIFFLISSTLLFNKIERKKEESTRIIKKWVSRLVLLYFVWFLINLKFIIYRKEYFSSDIAYGIFDLLKDLIFCYTYPGSWFLSALIVGVILIYCLTKYISRYIILFFSIFISIYIEAIDYIPNVLHAPYRWYAENIRPEVILSFPAHLVWISLGQIFSSQLDKIENNKKILFPLSILFSIACYLFVIWNNNLFINYLIVPSCFITFVLLKLSQKPIYKKMRDMSILIFFSHFLIFGTKGMFCKILNDTLLTNYIFYILVLASCVIFSLVILYLENKKGFHFLKYTH